MKLILGTLIAALLIITTSHSPFSYNTPIEPVEEITMDSLYLEDEEEIIEEDNSYIDDEYRVVNDLSILHPAFRNKVVKMLYECKKQGIELKVVETYRTPERQNLLKSRGYSMLNGGRSKHQHKIAVDVVPIVDGIMVWDDYKLWKKIGKIGKKQGLIWGGDWKRFRDYPHFEYPCSIDEVEFLPLPDTVYIPLFLNL